MPIRLRRQRPCAKKILYYRNPMGPPDTSPVPEEDSMGMDYIPVYAGEAERRLEHVKVSPGKLQRTGRALRGGGRAGRSSRHIRVPRHRAARRAQGLRRVDCDRSFVGKVENVTHRRPRPQGPAAARSLLPRDERPAAQCQLAGRSADATDKVRHRRLENLDVAAE